MAVLKILRVPEQKLYQKSGAIYSFGPLTHNMVFDLFETMYAAHGVGLAAPQVGWMDRLAVIDVTCGDDEAARVVLINPKIIEAEGEQEAEEGCLSIPGWKTRITRSFRVRVKAKDERGKNFEMDCEGLLARAVQHELDHLSGRLISRFAMSNQEISG